MKSLHGIYIGVVCRALLAAALCFVAGCKKEKSGEIELSDDAISFEEYSFSDSVTKGASTDTFSDGDNFGVYTYSVTSGGSVGSSTPPDIMENVEVTLNDLSWEYSPIAYWPPIGNDTHFIAYSPYEDADAGISVDLASSTGGYPTITYKMPGECTDQPDLLVASKVYLSSELGGGLKVNLTFDHKLSPIYFQVKGEAGMTLQSVILRDIYDAGDLTYDGSAWSWESYSSRSDFVFGAGITPTEPTSATDAVVVTTDDGYIMAVPQKIPSGAKVLIGYSLTSDLDTILERDITIPTSVVDEWEAGNKYLYTISLGSQISIEISDWNWVNSDDTQDNIVDIFKINDYEGSYAAEDSIKDSDGIEVEEYTDYDVKDTI